MPPSARLRRFRKLTSVALLAFSSGLPNGLTVTTLQAWMKSESVDIRVIGLFSMVGLPYAWKFLWSPLMDRFSVPFLGRRRGWILVTQIGLMLLTALMAFMSPARAPGLLAVVAFSVAFFSASQDIVCDAWRTDVLEPSELGPGAAIYIAGWRIAVIVSSGLALIMADHMPWRSVYLLMSASLLIGVAGTFLAPEPATTAAPPPKTLREAVIEPFREFLKRKGAYEVLGFAVIYKLDVVLALALMTPFLLEIGFSNTEIGYTFKTMGIGAALVGSAVGGLLMPKLGTRRSLWLFGAFQGVSGAAFIALAHFGHSTPLMVAAIGLENFCSGMGNTAYFAFIMSICDHRYSATQFALLTSLMAQARIMLAAPAGFLAKTAGWEGYYVISMLAGLPGLLLLLRYSHWTYKEGEAA